LGLGDKLRVVTEPGKNRGRKMGADGVSDDVFDRFTNASALFTIARGSSDAVATVLAYEFMRELRRPTTSLPPSVF
jgi:fructoselysine-6-P-deglycase FrlB-like protein